MNRRAIDATAAAIAGGVLATSTIRGIETIPAIVQGVVAGLLVGICVAIVTRPPGKHADVDAAARRHRWVMPTDRTMKPTHDPATWKVERSDR